MGAPDGGQAESNGRATFTQTHIHTYKPKTNTRVGVVVVGAQLLQYVVKQTKLPIND